MTTTPNPAVAAQLLDRLAETAEKLHRDAVVSDYEIACAFMSVAITVARATHGPALTAEWLRDTADEVENSDPRLQRRMN